MPKPTEPSVLTDQDDILSRQAGNDGLLDETPTSASTACIAARLARSELDAASLEMIVAALTAEVCDETHVPGRSGPSRVG